MVGQSAEINGFPSNILDVYGKLTGIAPELGDSTNPQGFPEENWDFWNAGYSEGYRVGFNDGHAIEERYADYGDGYESGFDKACSSPCHWRLDIEGIHHTVHLGDRVTLKGYPEFQFFIDGMGRDCVFVKFGATSMKVSLEEIESVY